MTNLIYQQTPQLSEFVINVNRGIIKIKYASKKRGIIFTSGYYSQEYGNLDRKTKHL